MAELYIDLHDDTAVVLLVEKGAVTFGRPYMQRVNSGESLRRLVAAVRTDSGADFKRAHLLVPGSEVMTSQHRTQAKAIEDARLIIGRAVAQESGEAAPSFLLTQMAAEHNQQVYLAEYLPRPTLEKYLAMFREARLRLQTISSSFQARQAFIAEMRGEIHQAQALFTLDWDGGIEATFFSHTEILQHEVLAGSGSGTGGQSAEGDDEERIGRRRLYETMNNLHIVYSRFMNQHPQAVVGKLWLGGTGCDSVGGAAGLADALRAEVELLLPAEVKELPDPQAYIAVVGCIRQQQARLPVNFISKELRNPFRANSRVVGLAVGGLFVAVALATVGITESRHAALKRQLADEQLALQSLQANASQVLEQLNDLRKIGEAVGKQIPIYDLFRELTVLLPQGVYLEGLDCLTPPSNEGAEVKLTTVMVYDDEFGSRRLLSQLVAGLEKSTVLGRPDEPVISYRILGKRKVLVAAITCKVAPRKLGN